MQHNYVNMRLIYMDMQLNCVDMHVINFYRNYFFLRVIFLLTPLSDILHAAQLRPDIRGRGLC